MALACGLGCRSLFNKTRPGLDVSCLVPACLPAAETLPLHLSSTQQRFRDEVNAKLANDVGNLLNRSLNVLKKNCDGVAPCDSSVSLPEDHPLREAARALVPQVRKAYEEMRFSEVRERGLCSSLMVRRPSTELVPLYTGCCDAPAAADDDGLAAPAAQGNHPWFAAIHSRLLLVKRLLRLPLFRRSSSPPRSPAVATSTSTRWSPGASSRAAPRRTRRRCESATRGHALPLTCMGHELNFSETRAHRWLPVGQALPGRLP